MTNVFYLIHVLLFYAVISTLSALLSTAIMKGKRIAYGISVLVSLSGMIAFNLLGLILQLVFSSLPGAVGTYVLPALGAGIAEMIFFRLRFRKNE